MAKYKMTIWGDFREPIIKIKTENLNYLEDGVKELNRKLKKWLQLEK